MTNFRQYLAQSDGMLDVSIQSAEKYLTSLTRKREFLNAYVEIEHKADGVKLTALKISDSGKNDWILSYKGNILYSEEFGYNPKVRIKSESVGASQFSIALEHFKDLGKTDIPVGTELLIEFLMRKPTLSSNYNTYHKMVLIGYSESTWIEEFGKLTTSNSGMFLENREQYAKELKIETPQILFKGVLGTESSFESGIVNANLKALFNNAKMAMAWDNPEILLNDISELLLDVPSKFGGKEEGVVIKIPESSIQLKIQQDYQLDVESRMKIKAKFQCDCSVEESEYWDNVTRTALEIVTSTNVGNRKLSDILADVSINIKKLKINFEHPKKTLANIKDDIQLTTKTQIIKQLKGNNNCLIVGKFRVLTKDGHVKLFQRASKLYDKVVVCIISSKQNANTATLREEMVRAAMPNAIIIHHSTGNLISIIKKAKININSIYSGTDRVATYREQLKRSLGVSVSELPRKDSDISASKVIEKIEDFEFFKDSTPEAIHHLYDLLYKEYT